MVDAEPSAGRIHLRGRYRLVRRIGRGGMGEVWQASIENAHGVRSLFALKVLHPEVLERKDHRALLVDEARIASRIQSPYTARVIELLDDDVGLCIVMEWIDGTPLARILVDGPLPLGVALRIAADVCAGLHAAHELRGDDGAPLDVVHRDVSPQNLIVDHTGVTKVVDFGIAKARGRMAKETTSGVKGKASYMSLEQARAGPIDRRADVFAVGIVLYEMLTGEHPFGAHDDLAALVALNERAAPRPFPASVPATVAAIVRRALQHDPAKRFPTALAMKSELDAALVDLGMPTDHPDVARALAARPSVKRHQSLPPADELPPAPLTSKPPSAPPPPPTAPASIPAPASAPAPRRTSAALFVVGALLLTGGAVAGAFALGRRTATPADGAPSSSAPSTASVTASIAGTVAEVPPAPPSVDPIDVDLLAPQRTASTGTARASAGPARSAAAPTADAGAGLPSCDPPWYIDSAGHRAYWKHCLRQP